MTIDQAKQLKPGDKVLASVIPSYKHRGGFSLTFLTVKQYPGADGEMHISVVEKIPASHNVSIKHIKMLICANPAIASI